MVWEGEGIGELEKNEKAHFLSVRIATTARNLPYAKTVLQTPHLKRSRQIRQTSVSRKTPPAVTSRVADDLEDCRPTGGMEKGEKTACRQEAGYVSSLVYLFMIRNAKLRKKSSKLRPSCRS